MTTGGFSKSSSSSIDHGNSSSSSSSSSYNNEKSLKRSTSVFESNEKVSRFPWLIIWSIIMNLFTFGISILFMALYWQGECFTSLIFLNIYCVIFLGNFAFGLFFHLRFSKNWEFTNKKRNIIWSSFLIFIACSIAVFIVTIFVKESNSCPKKKLYNSLVRANGIIDIVFLGGLLFYNIVALCTFSTDRKRDNNNSGGGSNKKSKKKKNSNVELEEQNVYGGSGMNNYKSNDSMNNYPQTPPGNPPLDNNYNYPTAPPPRAPSTIHYNPNQDHLPPYPSSAKYNI